MAFEITQFEQQLNPTLARKFNKGKHEDLAWAAEKQYALSIIEKNPALQSCTPRSLALAMMDVAWSGLSLNPRLGHGYLIPYDNQATFQLGYRGMEHLVYRAGTVKAIQTVLVHRGDEFRVQTINNRRVVTHRENLKGAALGEVTHAYAILHYQNGGEYVEVMHRTELDSVQAAAEKRKGGGAVWRSPFKGEMQRKAVLRRALKHAPLDAGGKMEHALAVADKYDPVEFDKEPIEREAVEELVSKEQFNEAHAYLTERGFPAGQADVWLVKLAEAMGFRRFDQLPAKHFAEAMTRLKARFEATRNKRTGT